jgi:rhodanese-related sulfurtransferase
MDRLEPWPLEDDALEITPQALQQRLNSSGEVMLIDVRQAWEHQIVHLPGALLIPLHELPARLGALDPAGSIIIYCHHGIRSYDATVFLRSVGFAKVQSLQGGIDRWSEDVDPSLPRY